jgi:hypothetical protein
MSKSEIAVAMTTTEQNEVILAALKASKRARTSDQPTARY